MGFSDRIVILLGLCPTRVHDMGFASVLSLLFGDLPRMLLAAVVASASVLHVSVAVWPTSIFVSFGSRFIWLGAHIILRPGLTSSLQPLPSGNGGRLPRGGLIRLHGGRAQCQH